MPNRYNDTLRVLRSGAEFVDSIGDLTTKQEESRNNREDRAIKKIRETQINANLSALGAGQPLRGTNQVQNESRRQFTNSNLVKQTQRGIEDENEYRSKLKSIVGWLQQNPGADPEKMPLDLYVGVQGHKAYGTVINQIAESEQGQTIIKKNRVARAKLAFKQFQATKGYINEALSQGKIEQAINGIEKLSQDLPLPYQVGNYDPKTKTFAVQYLDSLSGKFQETQRKSLQDVVAKINSTGEKEFVDQLALMFEATRRSNLAKRLNPMHGKNAKGTRFLIIPQKHVLDPNKVYIEVRNEKTNEKVIFPSWESVQDAGITIENLEREKAIGDIAYKDQQVKTSEAAQASYQSKDKLNKSLTGQADMKKALDIKKAQYEAAIKIFGGKTTVKDEFGRETVTDKVAIKEAFKFLEDHKDIDSIKTSEDAYKLEMANLIIQYNGQIAGNQGKAMGQMNQGVQAQSANLKQLVEGAVAGIVKAQQSNDIERARGILSQFKGQDRKAIIRMAKEQAIAQQPIKPILDMPDSGSYGERIDGTDKGRGFKGEIKNPDGTVSTELSITVDIDGQRTLIPLLIPTTTAREISTLQGIKNPRDIPKAIIDKAIQHAEMRISKGLSPFAQEGEFQQNTSALEWGKTPLGRFENAVIQAPEGLRRSEIANQEAYRKGIKKKTVGSAIPNIDTFRRTYK